MFDGRDRFLIDLFDGIICGYSFMNINFVLVINPHVDVKVEIRMHRIVDALDQL